ncbi:MAG: putative lipid II flippase FtsW [Brevinematales bacterium]|nr:putative lipid II flippase FtsW [Brevinematales bacterium]
MLNLRKVDGFLLFIFILLIVLGNLTVYTSSYFVAKRLTGNPYYFFIRQLIWTIPSLLSLLFFANYNYTNLRKLTKPMILLTFILLLLVFVPGIGKESGGARRWINLRLFDFNPSEFAKLSIIIYLSHILTKKRGKIEDFTFGLLPPLLLVSAIFFIILMQSGFSTASILLVTAFLMFFIGGASLTHIFSIGLLSLPVLIFFIWKVSYRMARIASFLNPWADPFGKGYHLIQSIKAFANGGLLGVGFGNGVQKISALPAPHTDFIFSVIVEEFGIIGGLTVSIIYLLIFIKGMLIAKNTEDNFGALLAFGIVTLFSLHAFLNIAITTGTIPPTGVSLPFLSYGGSSSLILSISCGILLNISKNTSHLKANKKEIEKIINEGF